MKGVGLKGAQTTACLLSLTSDAADFLWAKPLPGRKHAYGNRAARSSAELIPRTHPRSD